MIIDNNALYSIAKNILRIENPKYREYNLLIAKAMGDTTLCLRVDGNGVTKNTLNTTLKRYAMNQCECCWAAH